MPGSPLSAPRELRFRWYLQIEKHGKLVDEVCEIFGISRKTYYKWYRLDHGYGSNEYRSKRMHPETKIKGSVRSVIEEAKMKYNYGPQKMKIFLKKELNVEVSSTSIYKFFKKHKLIRKPQRKQPWYHPMKRRFKVKRPGQNVQLDVKYVPAPDGTWLYQYRFADVLTNMQYATDCLDRSGEATIHVFKEAKRFFPFEITGIQTDNGGEFRGVFAEHLKEQHVIHRFIPKRSAPWNGKVERANRSVDDEYYLNKTKPWKSLSEYVRWYNTKRIHLGKGMNGLTPLERYQRYLLKSQKVSPLKVN